eukprot:Em0001g2976a
MSDVTYEFEMSDKKKKRIFHVNMFRKWYDQQVTNSFWAEPEREAEDEDTRLVVNDKLKDNQRRELLALLKEFDDVLHSTPGKTDLVEYQIYTGSAQPVQLPAHWLPYAYKDQRIDEIIDRLGKAEFITTIDLTKGCTGRELHPLSNG